MQKPRKCRYCSVTVVFAKNEETGKVVPVDVQAPIYKVMFYEKETVAERVRETIPDDDDSGAPGIQYGVSHWATCAGREKAKADLEKRRGKSAGEAERKRALRGVP